MGASVKLGADAGHGFRVGDLVEIPRSQVLVAARRTDPKKSGYGAQGPPANTFEPSNETKKVADDRDCLLTITIDLRTSSLP